MTYTQAQICEEIITELNTLLQSEDQVTNNNEQTAKENHEILAHDPETRLKSHLENQRAENEIKTLTESVKTCQREKRDLLANHNKLLNRNSHLEKLLHLQRKIENLEGVLIVSKAI